MLEFGDGAVERDLVDTVRSRVFQGVHNRGLGNEKLVTERKREVWQVWVCPLPSMRLHGTLVKQDPDPTPNRRRLDLRSHHAMGEFARHRPRRSVSLKPSCL